MRARLVACAFAVALSACATSGPHHSSAAGHDPNVISADEIESSHETNAYDVIRSLRPNMLQTHGQVTFVNSDPGIVVFLNGSQYGPLQSLDRIPSKDIDEIHFYNASEASLRHGTGFPHGVIEVKTR
jgi:hypothetical protein